MTCPGPSHLLLIHPVWSVSVTHHSLQRTCAPTWGEPGKAGVARSPFPSLWDKMCGPKQEGQKVQKGRWEKMK